MGIFGNLFKSAGTGAAVGSPGGIPGMLIGGGIGLLSGLAETAFGNKLAQDNQAKQNEYNSPVSQMQRYQAAGLNPNLIYGQGNPGNQGSPVVQSSPRVSDAILKGIALDSARKQNALLDEQGNLLRAQQHEVYSKSQNEAMMSLVNQIRWMKGQEESKYFSPNAKYQSEMLNQQLQTYLKNLTFKDAQLLNLDMDNRIKRQVLGEKMYYNKLRTDYGYDKGDSFLSNPGGILHRSGMSIWRAGKELWDKIR